MRNRFLQFHALQSYSGVLLNRDDMGFAKRMPFGGVTRTRISSQCLKRHWRTYDGPYSLASIGEPMSIRSRHTFQRYVRDPLVDEGLDAKRVDIAVAKLMNLVLGKSKKRTGDSEEAAAKEQTAQVTVLGQPEVKYFKGVVREACQSNDIEQFFKSKERDSDWKKNLQALTRAAGLDAALFGRMVTSDILARADAAVHVAHAFTVHEELAEPDYFSAVDDLLSGGDESELGAAHINTTELTSGLFYVYVVVDVPLLISNLEGCDRRAVEQADRELAARVVENLTHIIATTSPGAKKGSTAPYSYANCLLVEAGDAMPRSLANAFLVPVPLRHDGLNSAYTALARHLEDLDRMYSEFVPERRMAAIGPLESLLKAVGQETPLSLKDLAQWAGSKVRGG